MENNFKRILLFILATLLLFFGAAFVFLYQKINNNNQKIQQDTINLRTEANRRESLASLDRTLQKIAPERALLENYFIKSSDIIPFLNMIEKLATEAGVSAQIDSIDTKADNSELTVRLKVSGGFEVIYKFLTLLENSPYELDFLSMDMRKSLSNVSDQNVKNSNWEVVFKIQLLSFIP